MSTEQARAEYMREAAARGFHIEDFIRMITDENSQCGFQWLFRSYVNEWEEHAPVTPEVAFCRELIAREQQRWVNIHTHRVVDDGGLDGGAFDFE